MSEPVVIRNLNDALIWQSRFPMPFADQVAAGMVEGADPISHGCTTRSLAAASGFVRWSIDQEVDTGFLTPGSTVYLVSDDAGDTDTCLVHGVDANGDFATAETTMTGLTPVAVAGTWNHIQKVIYTGAADNVGNIWCSTKSIAGAPGALDDIQAQVEPTFNYAVNPHILTPNNWTYLIKHIVMTTETKTAHCRFERDTQGKNIRTFEVDITDGFIQFDLDVPFYLREGDKMRVVVASLSGTVGGASFGFNGYILRGDTGEGRSPASVQAALYDN